MHREQAIAALGHSAAELSGALHTDPLQFAPPLNALVPHDLIGRLSEAGQPRFVL